MTATKAHLAARAVALRKQRLSLGLIGERLGLDHSTVAKYVRREAPELVGNVRARETLWLRQRGLAL